MGNKLLKLILIILIIMIIFNLISLIELVLTDTKVTKSFLVDYYFVEILANENDFDVFKDYMYKKGWEEVYRLGGLYVFEKDDNKKVITNNQIKTILIEGRLNLDYFKRFYF